MNWFKHDTDASNDAKIKKLILRYSATGYAVYFHGLELIAAGINENNITFELEHDAEIIADNLKISGTAEKSGREIVEEVMRYIVELGLFEESQGHIFCLKLLKRLDMSMTSSKKLRKIIIDAKKHHDDIMTHHDPVMINHEKSCKIRREEKRRDKKRGEDAELFAPVLDTVLNQQLKLALMDWIDNRKTMKKPVTPIALKKAIGSLNLWYPNDFKKQIACVEKSVVGGWQGIFPLNPADAEKTTATGPRNMSDYITAQEGSRAV